MPIGKEIYNQISKRHGLRKQVLEDKAEVASQPPAKVDQWTKNVVARAKSVNMHITELAGGIKRNVSPTEGKPAVNAKAGPEMEKKLVHKPPQKNKKLDVTAGAIELQTKKGTAAPKKKNDTKSRKCGNCGQAGHTRRTCSA